MKIHVPSKTILRTDKDAYLKYRVVSGGLAEGIDNVVWEDHEIYPYEEPTYDSATHKRTDVLVNNAGTYTYEVVIKTQAELDADLQAKRELMSLTPRQFRRQLNATGKRQQVEDYIAGLTQDDKDDWLFATSVDRLYPLTIAMITELGYNDTQADNFFEAAAQL